MHDHPTREQEQYALAERKYGEARRDFAHAMLCRQRGVKPARASAIFDGCTWPDALLYIKERLGAATSDWPLLLQGVFCKRMLDFYALATAVYLMLTRPIPLRDFKPSQMLVPGAFPQLEKLGESREIRVGHLPDGGEQIQLLTWARIFGVSDTLFQNDDVGLLNNTAELAGDAAAFAENGHFFEVLLSNSGAGPTLLDGTAFFDGTRGNLLGGAALDATSLGAALTAMGQQRSPGAEGQPLNLQPRYLLCGPSNAAAARVAVKALSTGSQPLLDVLVDGHIEDGAWYLFCDPNVRPAFVRGFLERSGPGPSLAVLDDFRREGVGWRVVTRFGVGPYDPRAAVLTPAP
jgi:hypothetical protein